MREPHGNDCTSTSQSQFVRPGRNLCCGRGRRDYCRGLEDGSTSVFNFAKIGPMFPDIFLVGLKNTLIYTALGFIVGLSGGLLLALMKLSSFPLYRWLATGYIEFFRGVPALLVFIAFGYGVPLAFGIQWDVNIIVMVSLGMVAAAYIAETLRAGLQAVPKGQMEAARSLGMPHWRAMVSIVIPPRHSRSSCRR